MPEWGGWEVRCRWWDSVWIRKKSSEPERTWDKLHNGHGRGQVGTLSTRRQRERMRRHLPAQKLKACENSPTHLDLTLTPIRALNEASCSAPRSLRSHPPHRGAGRVKRDLRELAQCLAQGKSSEIPCLCRPSPTPWTRHRGDSGPASVGPRQVQRCPMQIDHEPQLRTTQLISNFLVARLK